MTLAQLAAAGPASVVSVPPRSLSEWLGYQEQLNPRSIELGLERVAAVAERLELLRTPIPTLIIGGTNGKGSSAHLAALIYRQAGYRVGLYTSPHLLRYNERIVVDGVEASDGDLCRAFEAIEAARGDIGLTYFEFGTLAALWLFRRAGLQLQVLEVGLGGRLDAVNIIDADCAVVTQIGLDHQDWLGPDREAIGREKAGIYRRARPAICVDADPPSSLRAEALRLGADWRCLNDTFGFEAGARSWTWWGQARERYVLPLPGLGGPAQLSNAAGVLAAVESLQPLLPVPEAAIRAALPGLKVAGRFEQRGRWYFDVAHNAESAQVLAERLASHAASGPVWLILGMLADKPVEAVAAALAPRVTGVFFVGLDGPRALDAVALQARAAAGGLSGEVMPSMASAMAAAVAQARPEDPIVVCGSFLTVAAAIQQWELEKA